MRADVKYKKDIIMITVLFGVLLIVTLFAAMEYLSSMFIY